jgi:prefoldin subunit 5
MTTMLRRAAVSLLVLCAGAGPVTAQNREHQQLAAEIQMLQQQNQQLSLALTQLTEVLKSVNTRLDANEQFQQRRFADQELLVKNLGSDLSAIRERTQDTDTRLRTLRDEIDALRQTFLALPALLAQAQAASAPVDPDNPNAAAPAPDGAAPPTIPAPPPILTLPSTAGLSPNRLFDTAFADYGSSAGGGLLRGGGPGRLRGRLARPGLLGEWRFGADDPARPGRAPPAGRGLRGAHRLSRGDGPRAGRLGHVLGQGPRHQRHRDRT